MPITRPPVLPVWADTGDKTQPTDLEIATGWPVTSIPPSRQRFNWFFNMAANAVRYFSRRGLSDWKNDETYEIGDRCQSLVDGKTYRGIVAGNINFEPSANPAKWERWGFTLSELWTYLTSGLFGGACPATGPASPPSVASPFTKYKSVAPHYEYWQWVGDSWKVVAGYRHDAALVSNEPVLAATPKIVRTFTCHRPGTIAFSGQANLTSTSSNQAIDCFFSINGVGSARSSSFAPGSGWGIAVTTSHTLRLALNDVITMSIYSNTAANINWGIGISFID